jgi:hypothetical protein
VPAEIEPPDLARLVDFAERPRLQDWSLRAALVRYAQPRPRQVNDLLDLVRRVEWALGRHARLLQRDGNALWRAIADGTRPEGAEQAWIVELLRAVTALDRIGDVLAAWAVDISGERPDAAVEATIEQVGRRLDELGVPREERPQRRPRG